MCKLVLFFSLFTLSISAVFAQMSNEQVEQYIQNAIASGKSEQQIKAELLSSGIHMGQQRQGATIQEHTDNRVQNAVASPVGQPEGESSFSNDNRSNIFGHSLFHSKTMTFEPNENAATPSGYRIGPGDEVLVDIWGISEAHFKQKVTPEGVIFIAQVGAIPLNGLTVDQATEKIRHAVSSRYAGLGGGSTQISVTLGSIRTINVHMMGELAVPGTYRLSSFSTLLNALYRAGGITNSGSLRNVQLVRNGATIDTIDIYQYLFYGITEKETKLNDGDVIIVPPYEQLVTIEGQVKRPMMYELRRGETLEDALRYAGGFVGKAYQSQLNVVRQTGREKQIFTLNEKEYSQFKMADGDVVTVESNLTRYENMVSIAGAVYRPGEYELGGGIATVRQLIEHAEGLTPDAFLGRAVLIRENDDLSLQTIAIDLKKLVNGESTDLLLKKNDKLVVSRTNDLQDNGTMTILGWVNEPGTFPYAKNTSIEDMVIRAGGFKHGASTIRADVARRIYDPKSNNKTDQLAQVFTLSFNDGLALSENSDFTLEPYDIVIVRRSPDYSKQQKITIKGEVLFPGEYILSSTDERLSSVIQRAGGLTPNAYTKGSKLIRHIEKEEKEELKQVMENISANADIDALTMKQTLQETYPVGIQLDYAMKHRGSDHDIILQNGDEITIPCYDGTVRINGEVMRPNSVSYVKGKHARYYINQAGGYGSHAKKCKTFIVYPNGTVSRARWLTRVDPGCEIIVPQKNERVQMSVTERLALASATASLASVVIALIRLFQ